MTTRQSSEAGLEASTVLALFSGYIADRFLPGTEATLMLHGRVELAYAMPLTDDCGTFPLGCPPATQDSSCHTVDEAAPSCGLCPDTNPPPAGHCHAPQSADCGFSECPPPPPTYGCEPPPPPPPTVLHCGPPPPPPPPPVTTVDSGCSSHTHDCGHFTHPCANTTTDCHSPATIDHSCTSHFTTGCPDTYDDCNLDTVFDELCMLPPDTTEC